MLRRTEILLPISHGWEQLLIRTSWGTGPFPGSGRGGTFLEAILCEWVEVVHLDVVETSSWEEEMVDGECMNSSGGGTGRVAGRGVGGGVIAMMLFMMDS